MERRLDVFPSESGGNYVKMNVNINKFLDVGMESSYSKIFK